MPNDDMVDAMLAAVSGLDSVSGLSEVGFGDYSDEEVGRIVRRAHNMRRGGHMPPQATSSAHATPPRGVSAPMFQRSARETLRRPRAVSLSSAWRRRSVRPTRSQ